MHPPSWVIEGVFLCFCPGYRRLDKPIVEPVSPVFNVTVNPAVTQMPDGRSTIIGNAGLNKTSGSV